MKKQDDLREHSYDGIQEYDNDLPRWWLWLFWITIIFSVIYPFVYDFGPADFASETIDAEMASFKAKQQEVAKSQGPATEESLLALVKTASATEDGKQIYLSRCLPCHGDKGQGIVGPNLTDDYWIHGGKIMQIRSIVENGVIEKGMLPWKDQLTPQQIDSVVAYIWTMHGTNPPGALPPNGDLFKRE
jgi:cytochrome c oxidase cbb3-type subunit III